MPSSVGKQDRRGQVVVLVAFLMVFFVGVTGLVVDIGGAYSRQRFERSVADSASLSGAQELQTAVRGSIPSAAQYASARGLAMRSLVSQLDVGSDPTAPLPTCPGVGAAPYAADITNCNIPGTSFYVSISAPALTCATLGGCDPQKSVQVTVRQPDFGLVFARIFNQLQWNVVATSIAELGYSANYTLVTLRPPKPSRANDPSCTPNCDDNEDNIKLSGTNTRAFIEGDVGTNTNIELTAGAQIVMSPGYSVYHYDAYVNWTAPPPEKQLSSPIDVVYPVPSEAGGTTFTTDAQARIADPTLCDAERDKVPAVYGISGFDSASGEIRCYKPGIYDFKLPNPGPGEPQPDVILLTPGLYFFHKGVDAGSNTRFIGGYEPDSPGVALVFPTECTPACKFNVENSPMVALNAGSAIPTIASGLPATAAMDYSGNPVDTGGDEPILMTIIVLRDPSCVVGPTEPITGCLDHNQLKLPGGGSLYLTGVQYAASDQSTIVGGSAGTGYIGQFISWTVTYTGGSQIRFTHAGDEGPGVLRIATPCSPGAICAADYSDDPIP
jgi:Flp pilus assembly protein TadG